MLESFVKIECINVQTLKCCHHGLFKVGAWCIRSSADLALHHYKVDPNLPLQLFQMLCLSAAVSFADYSMTMQRDRPYMPILPFGILPCQACFWQNWHLQESFLDEGFILDKRIGVGQPKRIENAKILVANTAMDTDKIKIYGARVRVDSMAKVQLLRRLLMWLYINKVMPSLNLSSQMLLIPNSFRIVVVLTVYRWLAPDACTEAGEFIAACTSLYETDLVLFTSDMCWWLWETSMHRHLMVVVH